MAIYLIISKLTINLQSVDNFLPGCLGTMKPFRIFAAEIYFQWITI